MRRSGEDAVRSRKMSKKTWGFSGCWQPGDTVTAFYPIFWDEETESYQILVAMIWGHRVNDMEALPLKRVFIPSLSLDRDNCAMKPKPDLLVQLHNISKLIIDGKQEIEMNRIWKDPNMEEREKQERIVQIVQNYTESKNADKKGYKPIISDVVCIISTECLAVVYDKVTKRLNLKDTRLRTQDLSDERIEKLQDLLKSSEFLKDDDNQHSKKYIEVTYVFPADKSKKQAGKTDPKMVKPIKEKYPDEWEFIESKLLRELPTDTETIINRNSSYEPVSKEELISAISCFLSNSQGQYFLNHIKSSDISKLVKNMEIIKTCKLKFTTKDINDALETVEKESTLADREFTTNINPKEAPTVTIDSMLSDDDVKDINENIGA